MIMIKIKFYIVNGLLFFSKIVDMYITAKNISKARSIETGKKGGAKSFVQFSS